MLTWNDLLGYIKGRLALPSTFIEKNDQQMIDWIKLTSIREFSDYYPDVERVSVLVENDNYKVTGRYNRYYFFDEENLNILGIKQCYYSGTNDFVSGHPIMGEFNFEDYKWWSLQVFQSRFFSTFSNFSYNFQFIPPNMVEILPNITDNFVIEYERSQPPDLRRIPAAMERLFMDLCYADIAVQIGSIRTKYGDGSIQTPFGEIPLKGEQLVTEGIELRKEIVEKMQEDSIPPIVIDIQ